jgi:hypothetical protein
MSEVVGLGVLAISAVIPVVVARTVLAVMMAPLSRRPAPASTPVHPRP